MENKRVNWRIIIIFFGVAIILSMMIDHKRISQDQEDLKYELPPTNGNERGFDYENHEWLYNIGDSDTGPKKEVIYSVCDDGELDEFDYEELEDQYGD